MEYINEILNCDVIEGLQKLPNESVHCVVTSPPYWGLRDYGVEGQLGLENTPEEFIANMVKVFDEVHRVLRNDGTLWLNIGDSYAGSGKGGHTHSNGVWLQGTNIGMSHSAGKKNLIHHFSSPQYKPKDLVGIPWMLAFALRNSGWYLRQDIVWSKPNPMPESVKDRCTKAHEYLFLLTKSPKYFYDNDAIRVPVKNSTIRRVIQDIENQKGSDRAHSGERSNGRVKACVPKRNPRPSDNRKGNQGTGGIPIAPNGGKINGHNNYLDKNGELLHGSKANKRSVWTVTTKGYTDAHFATFPEELIVDCIKAGTSDHGCCSQCGAPYERATERTLVPTAKAAKTVVVDERDLSADGNDQGSNRAKDGHKPGHAYAVETKGWVPTCQCAADVEPCVVLDPFFGAGTTGLVARKLQRNFLGIELNSQYVQIAQRRLQKVLGLFI